MTKKKLCGLVGRRHTPQTNNIATSECCKHLNPQEKHWQKHLVVKASSITSHMTYIYIYYVCVCVCLRVCVCVLEPRFNFRIKKLIFSDFMTSHENQEYGKSKSRIESTKCWLFHFFVMSNLKLNKCSLLALKHYFADCGLVKGFVRDNLGGQ